MIHYTQTLYILHMITRPQLLNLHRQIELCPDIDEVKELARALLEREAEHKNEQELHLNWTACTMTHSEFVEYRKRFYVPNNAFINGDDLPFYRRWEWQEHRLDRGSS